MFAHLFVYVGLSVYVHVCCLHKVGHTLTYLLKHSYSTGSRPGVYVCVNVFVKKTWHKETLNKDGEGESLTSLQELCSSSTHASVGIRV